MNHLQGTWALVRFVVARDRVRFLVWVAGIVLLVITTAASTKGIYSTQKSLDEAAALAIDNPSALAFNGPAQALDTLGGQVAFQLGAFGLLVVGLMTLLLVGRLTRAEEDSGRLELVRAMPVGRHAPLAAGLVVVAALDVLVGALTAVSLGAQDLPWTGSVVLGASYTAFGFALLGITAVAAQISENPRVASGAAGAVLGVAFAIRAVGDIGDGTLSWLSPMGWAQKARPYAGERWWPVLLLVLLGAALVRAAIALANHRDFGAGVVAPRPGPAVAAPSLASPLGLAARLSRGAVLWWSLGVLALGLVYGSLADSIDDFVSDNEALADMVAGFGGADLTTAYLATSLLVTALLATGPGIQIASRLRTEESLGRAEAILATPTSRVRWVGSLTATALGAGTIAVVVGGFGLGAGYALTGGGAGQIPRLVGASLVYLPAVWVLTALVVALFGVRPRWTAGAWVAFAGCFVIAMFGVLLDLPAFVLDLSPFQHTPAVPADPLEVLPLAVLLAGAAVLAAVGLLAFRRRDLVTS